MIKVDPFTIFDKDWALVTAGTLDAFNGMTISWGLMGTLWNLPVVQVLVRPVRHTYKFMEDHEYFTVCFFPEDCRKDLVTMGTTSGRDGDKLKNTSLKAVAVGESVGYEQAHLTLLCKKLYWQDLDPECIPQDVKERLYPEKDWHHLYVGQVVEILAK